MPSLNPFWCLLPVGLFLLIEASMALVRKHPRFRRWSVRRRLAGYIRYAEAQRRAEGYPHIYTQEEIADFLKSWLRDEGLE